MNITDKITITCEDNMELMKRYPDGYFSIGITDIPYGIDVANMSFVKERSTLVTQKNGTKSNPNRRKNLQVSDWDKKVPNVEFWNEFKRVTREQIMFGVEYVEWPFGKGRIKWNKGFSEGVSFKSYEMAYCSFIDYTHEIDCLWAGMMQAKSILEPMIQQGNKQLNEKRLHPTQKPVILWDLIFLFCIEKGIDISSVLDTNLGVGSLAISSTKFDISEFVGCDISDTYINKAIERIQNHVAQQKLF